MVLIRRVVKTVQLWVTSCMIQVDLFETRMHSSRMCIIRRSGRLGCLPRGCLPGGCVCPGGCLLGGCLPGGFLPMGVSA